ncbi:hypothetical protein OTB20_21540 [Streptomyces sp. H27-H1]|uniref:hypothetical protein n=1 Tax=Streptomyces sp. H27-H1 TaxID=2996461 RepID=UPI00226E0225|nr:hypothetical protein [Streptomyces sp. H27-H1]MCY0928742.1 hypothetical protein [Streptomyces sp. H27-H1]
MATPGGADRLYALTDSGTLRELPDTDPGGTLLAADSWLVTDGRVRALDRHWHRFATTCAETADIPRAHLDSFWTPRWRTSCPGTPAPGSPAWSSNAPRRTHPRTRSCPAPTACCTGCAPPPPAAPRPGSGAWPSAPPPHPPPWEGETLCHPAGELPVLPGVTAALLLDHAARTGVPVRPVRRRLSALADREVWVTNALHGCGPSPPGPTALAEQFAPGRRRTAADVIELATREFPDFDDTIMELCR